jgi:hypothetical protein
MSSPPLAAGVHWANHFLQVLMGEKNFKKTHPEIGEEPFF